MLIVKTPINARKFVLTLHVAPSDCPTIYTDTIYYGILFIDTSRLLGNKVHSLIEKSYLAIILVTTAIEVGGR